MNKATISAESELGKGTTFKVLFPHLTQEPERRNSSEIWAGIPTNKQNTENIK